MDPKRFREAYDKLQHLDERMGHRVRPRRGALHQVSPRELEEKLRDVASYTLELKEVVEELFQAIAGKPGPKSK